MFKYFKSLFDNNEKQLKAMQPIIDEIVSHEDNFSGLTDEQLANKTKEFRKKLGVDPENPLSARDKEYDKAKTQEILFEILPEAFATVREMASRKTNHKHFPVQLLSGYTLATNKVSELFTGEGKTNAANLPLYLYALTGRGAHLITVNDYLARRDGEWNGHILTELGITVGIVNNSTQYKFVSDEEAIKIKGADVKKAFKERDEKAKDIGRLKLDQMNGDNLIEVDKKEVYACDVIFGTNNEFGFDYLRDNMSQNKKDVVQGPLHYAIVDEADSILIDEARTPLIISQSASAANDMYKQFANVVKQLNTEEHYVVDEKAHSVAINDIGIDKIEKLLNVENAYEDGTIAYHLDNALKAKELYQLDDKYIVRDGEILIVDEFTGRMLAGRRYSEGLHQAIEAKEGVEVKRESRTLATITLQNYFRLYDFLAGMTATALTEAEELANIYKLDVVVVPTNKPVVRKDGNDVVYRTQKAKFNAIVEDIKEHHEKGQPVLVGTTSVEKSELIADMLLKSGVKHEVLNAKQHEREANIVQTAGQQGAVTIATNMAGRGTDIALGEGVKELGGLYVIGTERHESRRIDNQLRGRAGRQGDPGESLFFVSFEDDLMRIFGGDRMQTIMQQVGLDENVPISMGILGKTIENAQKRVEAHNYDIRKRLVEYDDVLNQQREIIYSMRKMILNLASNSQDREYVDKKDIKLRKEFFKDFHIEQLMEEIDAFTLINEESWDSNALSNFEWVNKPINLWILKRYIDTVRTAVASQLKDDMKIDNIEERTLVTSILNYITEDAFDKGIKYLDFKDRIEFFRSLDKLATPLEQEMQLLKAVVFSFIVHVTEIGQEPMEQLSKLLILQTVDNYWMEHLDAMAGLRDGISMRSLAQKDPLVEYKNEGYMLFESMLSSVNDAVVNRFFKVKVVRQQRPIQADAEKVDAGSALEGKAVRSNAKSALPMPGNIGRGVDNRPGQSVTRQSKVTNVYADVGRNDPCPCGSGKKFKKCHGSV
jgi:preprotein translocase subunit SecA